MNWPRPPKQNPLPILKFEQNYELMMIKLWLQIQNVLEKNTIINILLAEF